MSKKELSKEQLAILDQSYPIIEDNNNRQTFPRMGVLADDIVEENGTGKNKKIKVLQSAGTFFTSENLGEVNEEGKKVWTAEYLDENVDVIIAFHRYQLKIYDKGLKKYISSQVYDTANQHLSLFLDKQVIKKGTEKELQSLYPELTVKGKPTTGLKKQMILYVIYNGKTYQFDTNQSSQFSFRDYQKTVTLPSVITIIGSTPELAGGTKYRKLTFKKKRMIDNDEFENVTESQNILKDIVEADKRFLVPELASGEQKAEDDFAALPGAKE